jgi:hypothetical protein
MIARSECRLPTGLTKGRSLTASCAAGCGAVVAVSRLTMPPMTQSCPERAQHVTVKRSARGGVCGRHAPSSQEAAAIARNTILRPIRPTRPRSQTSDRRLSLPGREIDVVGLPDVVEPYCSRTSRCGPMDACPLLGGSGARHHGGGSEGPYPRQEWRLGKRKLS